MVGLQRGCGSIRFGSGAQVGQYVVKRENLEIGSGTVWSEVWNGGELR